MSSFSIEKIPGESIVLGTTHETWHAEVDISLWAAELYQALDALDEPVTYIGDLTAGKPWTFDELLRTANAVARGQKPVFHHPNIKEVIIVTPFPIVKLAALGLQSGVFGSVPVKVFAALGEALAYARQN